MLCKKCGAELPDGTEKCIFCGETLGSEEPAAEENVPNQPEEEKVYDENERKRREQIERMIAEKKQQLSEIEERRNVKKKKQQRNRIVVIAVIVFILAVGAGAGTYYIRNNTRDKQIATATPSPKPSFASGTPTPTAEPATPTPEVTPSPEPTVQATTAPSSNGQTGKSTNSGSGTSSSLGNKTSSSNKSTSAAAKPTVKATPVPKSTGITTAPINSKLVVGGQVMQYNGRWFMTFTADNTLYYANVSPGSTTAQISGKYMTVSAVPTQDIHYGNTIYEITSMTKYDGGKYIISDSNTRLLTEEELSGYTKAELGLARNEIYARHGRKFKTAEYNNYFSKCSWYSINPNYNYNDDSSNLNSIEKKNAALILKVENSK